MTVGPREGAGARPHIHVKNRQLVLERDRVERLDHAAGRRDHAEEDIADAEALDGRLPRVQDGLDVVVRE